MNGAQHCRGCGSALTTTFVDLGLSPLSNAYVRADRARAGEPFYPLHAYVCDTCFLVQVDAFESAEQIFGDYAYFSSYSDSWLAHCRQYAQAAHERLQLGNDSLVIEAASNDGYLLQYFRELGTRTLGVEPARNVAAVAQQRGIETEPVFLGADTAAQLAKRYGAADLLIANNVVAHVPDLHDFFAGLRTLLKPSGTLTVEFPHLVRLIEGVEFDTIYHEHFSYYSFYAFERVLERHGLQAVDVQELPTHGGSLRVWIGHAEQRAKEEPAVAEMRAAERRFGIADLATYEAFSRSVELRKREILSFLIDARNNGKTVAGYGAPAKGNTLLNYCGVRADMIAYTVDRNPAKQGTLLPGSRIPVFEPARLRKTQPDFVFVLPWNLKDEIVEQLSYVRDWGGRFVTAVPSLQIW